MIDQARELVLDVVNDMKVDPRNSSIVVNGLDQEISQKKTDPDKYKDERGFGPQDDDENLISDPVYIAKVEELEKCKTDYDTRVNKNTYPHLMNDTVPTEIYSITYNNSWDMSFGYMTTCIKCNDLEIWYDLASADPNNVSEIRIDHKKRKNAKESLCTLADCFNHPSYYTCSGDEGHTCPLPNCKKMLDIVVAIIPENTKTHLKIPVFVFEVIGTKKIWGQNERHFPGFVATLQALAFAPYAYYGEVDGDTVSLYHFQKIAEEGQIEITKEDFTYAVDGSIAEVFGDIFTKFVDIFTDIFVNCTWINHESARLLNLSEYQNFVASLNPRSEIGVEMHCWHMFDKEYFNQDNNTPEEFTDYDYTDPGKPVPDDENINMQTFNYTVPADEIVPVVSSDATIEEIKETKTRVENRTGFPVLAHIVSRAVRHHQNGTPTDPLRGEHWNAADNKFHSNISSYYSKHYPDERDRFNHFGRLNHAHFHDIFNKHIHQRPNTQQKPLTDQVGEDASAQMDHVLDSNDSDEDYMDPMMDNLCWIIQQSEIQTPRQHGHRQGHRQVQLDHLLEDGQLQDHVLDLLPVTEVNVYTHKHTSSHFIRINYCNT